MSRLIIVDIDPIALHLDTGRTEIRPTFRLAHCEHADDDSIGAKLLQARNDGTMGPEFSGLVFIRCRKCEDEVEKFLATLNANPNYKHSVFTPAEMSMMAVVLSGMRWEVFPKAAGNTTIEKLRNLFVDVAFDICFGDWHVNPREFMDKLAGMADAELRPVLDRLATLEGITIPWEQ